MSLTIKALSLLLFVLSGPYLRGQVSGCKDPNANNYNINATVNDGSCVYNSASYTPPVKVASLSNALSETSGLQWANGHLWTFNDGGGQPALYKIDTVTNTIWQTITLAGSTNVDWEDIAFDGSYFYIGDIGNNNGNRTDLKIYKFPIAMIPDHSIQPEVIVPASVIEVISFRYADQPEPIISTGTNNTKYDCEAMIVDEGAIHLFTKDWINKTTTHYRINSVTTGSFIAESLESFSVNYLVTGADKTSSKSIVILLGYNNDALGTHYLHVLSDFSGGLFFNGNKRRIDLPNAAIMGQSEGVTFRNEIYGYISNERFERSIGGFSILVEPKLRALDLTQFIPVYVLPLKLKSFTVSKVNSANQITWQFEQSVSELTVEHSNNGTQFTVLTNFTKAKQGSIIHQPKEELNFYRLNWLDAASQRIYSKIIKVQNHTLEEIEQITLKATGELNFTLNSNTPHVYELKISNPEGKLIYRKGPEQYLPGRQILPFKSAFARGQLLYVTICSSERQKTWLLQLQ